MKDENEISLINRRHQYLVSTVALDNHVLNMHVKCKYHFVRLRIICGECKQKQSLEYIGIYHHVYRFAKKCDLSYYYRLTTEQIFLGVARTKDRFQK